MTWLPRSSKADNRSMEWRSQTMNADERDHTEPIEIAGQIQKLSDSQLRVLARYLKRHYGLTFQGLLEEMEDAAKRDVNPTTGLVPIGEWHFDTDYSYHRTITCKNHPTARYLSKNPYDRHLFLEKSPDGFDRECPCPFTDLAVIAEESQPPL